MILCPTGAYFSNILPFFFQHYLSMMTSKMWEKQRKTCQTWMSDLLSLQSQTSSFLSISNLAEASKIVNFPFSYEIGSSDTLPNSLLRIFIYSEVFMYRELLPYLFFNPHRATTGVQKIILIFEPTKRFLVKIQLGPCFLSPPPSKRPRGK